MKDILDLFHKTQEVLQTPTLPSLITDPDLRAWVTNEPTSVEGQKSLYPYVFLGKGEARPPARRFDRPRAPGRARAMRTRRTQSTSDLAAVAEKREEVESLAHAKASLRRLERKLELDSRVRRAIS